jgi:hypothetical protein
MKFEWEKYLVEKIATKYLNGKRKEVVEWNRSTGNVRVVIYDAADKVLKETMYECERN